MEELRRSDLGERLQKALDKDERYARRGLSNIESFIVDIATSLSCYDSTFVKNNANQRLHIVIDVISHMADRQWDQVPKLWYDNGKQVRIGSWFQRKDGWFSEVKALSLESDGSIGIKFDRDTEDGYIEDWEYYNPNDVLINFGLVDSEGVRIDENEVVWFNHHSPDYLFDTFKRVVYIQDPYIFFEDGSMLVDEVAKIVISHHRPDSEHRIKEEQIWHPNYYCRVYGIESEDKVSDMISHINKRLIKVLEQVKEPKLDEVFVPIYKEVEEPPVEEPPVEEPPVEEPPVEEPPVEEPPVEEPPVEEPPVED